MGCDMECIIPHKLIPDEILAFPRNHPEWTWDHYRDFPLTAENILEACWENQTYLKADLYPSAHMIFPRASYFIISGPSTRKFENSLEHRKKFIDDCRSFAFEFHSKKIYFYNNCGYDFEHPRGLSFPEVERLLIQFRGTPMPLQEPFDLDHYLDLIEENPAYDELFYYLTISE